MINLRRSDERGHVETGWLQSWHSFSFGSYHDPRYMGVSVLRVLNEDHVAPGAGFETHPHRDMEILTYVQNGVLEHRDSMGNVGRLKAGEFQVMTAGTGITHSEYIGSAWQPLRFLQIWIRPNRQGLTPGYRQLNGLDNNSGVHLVASPDGRSGSLLIHQDVLLSQFRLNAGESLEVGSAEGRTAYVHLTEGALDLGDTVIRAGDGAVVTDDGVEAIARLSSGGLLFDLP